MHRLAGGLRGDQEPGELQGIEVGLRQRHHHHHPADVGDRRPLQQVVAGFEAHHSPPPRPPVDGRHRHPVTDADLQAALVETGAAGAQQAAASARLGAIGAQLGGPVKTHQAEIGLQSHHPTR